MTYVVNWSSQLPYNNDTGEYAAPNIGKNTINITNNSTNLSTSIVLTGQGWSGYGQMQQENYLRLMENFASETAPANPTAGQLWYQTNTSTLNIFSVAPAYNTITGSVSTGTFTSGETIMQASTLATAILIGTVPPSGPITAVGNSITGTPDATHVWTGQTSLATFTPTSVPVYTPPGTPASTAVVSSASIAAALGFVPSNTSIAGTANQVLVNGTSGVATFGPITLTLPQSIATTSSPTFGMGAVGGSGLTLMGPVINPTDATTKAYVDSHASGITVETAVQAATTANLTASYMIGSSDSQGGTGVGATLTNSGPQAAFSVDGYAASVSDRILVKDQSSQIQNGVYTVTSVGSGSSNWILTRATDYNDGSGWQVTAGDYFFVQKGTTNAYTSWVQTATGSPILIGTDPIVFTIFSSQAVYTGGTGISVAGTLISNTGVTSFSAGTTGLTPSSTTTGAVTLDGILNIGNGGTGIGTTPANGQLLIGNGSHYVAATVGSGTGISTTVGAGTLTINNTGVTSLAGTANQITASAATGAITLSLPGTITVSITGSSASCTGNAASSSTCLGNAATATTASNVAGGYVSSFNGRQGAVTLTSSDVGVGFSGGTSTYTTIASGWHMWEKNLATGIIRQWGYNNATLNSVTFPVAFTTNYAFSLIQFSPSSGAPNAVATHTLTDFTVQSDALPFWWTVEGF